MSPKTGVEVRMSIDEGKSFKTVLKSEENSKFDKFNKAIPEHVNLHFAVWDKSDNNHIKNASSFLNFKYRSPTGEEEVHYVFDEPDYFTAYNIAS
jgi:hypothetical protein